MQQLGDWPDYDLVNNTLVVATFHNPPYTLVDPMRPRHVSGFLADLMTLLAQAVGVTLSYDTNTTVGDFGVLRPDGSYSGLVGRLVNRTAHLALAPMSWHFDRSRVVDYAGKVPVATEQYTFLVPGRPRASINNLAALLTPFDRDVWICLLCGMLLAAILLRVTVTQTVPRDQEDNDAFGVVSSVVHVYACVVQQGWSTTPSRPSSRLVMLTSRLLGILIYIEYTATLISVMTVTRTTADVSSVEDFVSRRDWSLLVQPGLSYTSDWKTSKEASLRQLHQRLESGRGVTLLTPQTVHRMLEPNTVSFFALNQAYISIRERACVLVTLPIRESPGQSLVSNADHAAGVPQFLTMQKHMRLKSKIDKVMQSMYQSGTIDSLFNRWFWNSTNRHCSMSAKFRPLAFDDLLAIVYMIPAGVVISLLVLLLEHLAVYCVNSTDIHYWSRDSRPVEHQLWRM